MPSVTVTLQDTGEVLTFDYTDPLSLLVEKAEHILPANDLEGRPTTTFWRDPAAKEAYRLTKLAEVNGA